MVTCRPFREFLIDDCERNKKTYYLEKKMEVHDAQIKEEGNYRQINHLDLELS